MPKVPVWALAAAAYRDVAANWHGLARIGGIWFLLMWLPVTAVWDSPAVLLVDIVALAATVAMAVAWHRHILEDAPLTRWMAPLDAGALRYLWRSILCTGMGFGVLLAASTVLVLGTVVTGTEFHPERLDRSPLMAVTFVLAVLVATYLVGRLQLVFPAAAIGDGATGFFGSWQITKGNGWRLALGLLLVALPVSLAKVGLSQTFALLAERTGSIGARALSALFSTGGTLICAALGAAFISYAYLWFRERRTANG